MTVSLYPTGRLKAAKDDRWSDYYHLISGAAKAGNLDIVLMLQKNFYQAKDTLPTLDGIRNVRTVNMCVIWSTMLDRIDEMQDVSAFCQRQNLQF